MVIKLVIGDSVQDVVILQSENKMKAALGQNVKITLPKAYQINRTQNKSCDKRSTNRYHR